MLPRFERKARDTECIHDKKYNEVCLSTPTAQIQCAVTTEFQAICHSGKVARVLWGARGPLRPKAQHMFSVEKDCVAVGAGAQALSCSAKRFRAASRSARIGKPISQGMLVDEASAATPM